MVDRHWSATVTSPDRDERFRALVIYGWSLMAYTILVVLWGAYVRATGSGAGCGNHWPLCNGEVVPRAPGLETLIEYVHRVTSGLAFLLVVVLLIWVFRACPRGSQSRLFAALTMLFMVTEALVGAGLVLFGLVGEDQSFARAWVMAFHLVNTLLLLCFMTLTIWFVDGTRRLSLKKHPPVNWLLMACLAALVLLGASGAVAALGDTLFPAESLTEALQQDFSAGASFLIRLRVYHPVLALLVGLLLISVAVKVRDRCPEPRTQLLALVTSLFFLAQLGVGLVNLLLLAPVWLQLVHLFMADAIWIGMVLVTASALSERIPLVATE